MEEYIGDFTRCVIESCPTENLGYERNKCLGNAYKAAIYSDALMVEGLMRISGANFVVHAWNKLGDSYFDPTKDYIFESSEFKEELMRNGIENLFFDYAKSIEYPVSECNKDEEGNIIFRYSYKEMLKIANKDQSTG